MGLKNASQVLGRIDAPIECGVGVPGQRVSVLMQASDKIVASDVVEPSMSYSRAALFSRLFAENQQSLRRYVQRLINSRKSAADSN